MHSITLSYALDFLLRLLLPHRIALAYELLVTAREEKHEEEQTSDRSDQKPTNATKEHGVLVVT